MTSSRCLAALLVLGGAIALGCSILNDGNVDDRVARAWTPETCLSVCERTQECPNATPLDCDESCATFDVPPCAPQGKLAFECLSGEDVCDPLPVACADEIDAYNLCREEAGTAGCSPENAPSSASCETICAGGPFSCFESEAACVESCSNGVARSELVDCAAEYQASLGCLSTCADICALSGNDCLDARYVFLDCDARYCEANPDSEPCRIETI